MRRFFNFFYIASSAVRRILEVKRAGLKPEKRLKYLLYDEDDKHHICVNCFGRKLEIMGTPEIVLCVKHSWMTRQFVVWDFEKGGRFVTRPTVVRLKGMCFECLSLSNWC